MNLRLTCILNLSGFVSSTVILYSGCSDIVDSETLILNIHLAIKILAPHKMRILTPSAPYNVCSPLME